MAKLLIPKRYLNVILIGIFSMIVILGLVVYAVKAKLNNVALYLEDISRGGVTRLTDGGADTDPAFSPKGDEIAFVHSEKPKISSLRVLSLNTGKERVLLDNGALNINPSWSSDGGSIVFTSDIEGQKDIWRIYLADNHLERITNDADVEKYPHILPDGNTVFFTQMAIKNREELFLIPSEGGEKARLSFSRSIIYSPRYSTWITGTKEIAYLSLNDLVFVDENGARKRDIKLKGLEDTNSVAIEPLNAATAVFKARPEKDIVLFQLYLYRMDTVTKQIKLLRKAGYFETGHDFSPDGEHIVYSR